MCEGEDLVEAGVAAGAEPVDRLVAGADVEPELLAEISTLAHPPRVLAVFRRADLPVAGEEARGLALWRVADPGNVGTLLRSADAFGAAVYLSAGCADPTGPKALRASMGSIFRVPTGRFDDAPGRRIALVPRGGTPLGDARPRPSRSPSSSAPSGRGCPRMSSLPAMRRRPSRWTTGAESLNVAVAGSIALYELSRS